jgi:hypothetical protein
MGAAPEALAKRPGSAGDEIVALAAQHRGERAGEEQAVGIGGRDRDHIAILDEGEQRFQFVIAVATPRADVERQVELGLRGLDDHWVSPSASLALSRAISPASAVTWAARQA